MVAVAVLSLLAGLPFQAVHASVYQASAESVAPQWINALSRPVAVIGLNLSQNSGERLQRVGVNFTDVGGDGGFNSSDLSPLAAGASSGVALYADNKTGGTPGAFDRDDPLVPLAQVPQWSYTAGGVSTSLLTGGAAIPGNDLGNNTGSDFFVVIRTSASPSRGDDFTVSIAPGDLQTDDGAPDFPPVETPVIVFDIQSPRADAGTDVTVDEGVEMGFSAAGSADDTGIANYTWTFGDFGPGNLRYGVYVTYTFNSPGRFFVLLNVSDYAGNSDESMLLVTVRNLNQPPVITSIPPITARQASPYVYLMQASDPDGDALRFSAVESQVPKGLSINSTTGLVLWVPGPDDSGSIPVTLAVTDGNSAPVTQNFRIDVQRVNNAPAFQSYPVQIATQDQHYSYRAEARDRDNDQLTYSLVAGPRGMTVGTYTGDVRWMPAWDQVGLNRVVLSAADRDYTVYQEFMINVTNANDPPRLTSTPPPTALQGVPYTYQVLAFDPDGDELRYSLNASPAGMLIGPVSGIITWTPGPEQVGANAVIVQVSDGHGGSTPQTFAVNVVNVNDPPRIESAPPSTTRQGALYTYRVQVFDPDGDPVVLSLLSAPPGMAINASSGVIEWVPGQESVGRVVVTVLASDRLGGIDVQAFDLTVLDKNDDPVFEGAIEPVAYQNRPYVTRVRARDPDGDALTFTLLSQLEDISLDRRTGTLVWFPRIPQEAKVAIRITDQNGSSVDEIFNVTVLPSPAPPVVAPIGLLRARAGEPWSYLVSARDPGGGRLRFSVSGKHLAINSTSGLIRFTPGEDDVGAHEFSVDVLSDSGLNTTVIGVLVVEAETGGTPLSRIAGFGLAGLGGADPRLILALTLIIGGALFYQYARLRRREERERPEEEALLGREAAPPALRSAAGEERPAPPAGQKAESEGEAQPGGREEPADRERLERKAREWDAALREQREARELREKQEAERRERELSDKGERERSGAEERDGRARLLREAGEAGRREVLERAGPEKKVLSRDEQERLEREIERELAEAGLGGLDDGEPGSPPPAPGPDNDGAAGGNRAGEAPRRKKVAPKRMRRRG